MIKISLTVKTFGRLILPRQYVRRKGRTIIYLVQELYVPTYFRTGGRIYLPESPFKQLVSNFYLMMNGR